MDIDLGDGAIDVDPQIGHGLSETNDPGHGCFKGPFPATQLIVLRRNAAINGDRDRFQRTSGQALDPLLGQEGAIATHMGGNPGLSDQIKDAINVGMEQGLAAGDRDDHGPQTFGRLDNPRKFWQGQRLPRHLLVYTPLISAHPTPEIAAIRNPEEDNGQAVRGSPKEAAESDIEITEQGRQHDRAKAYAKDFDNCSGM